MLNSEPFSDALLVDCNKNFANFFWRDHLLWNRCLILVSYLNIDPAVNSKAFL